jgi:hypothetical protein
LARASRYRRPIRRLDKSVGLDKNEVGLVAVFPDLPPGRDCTISPVQPPRRNQSFRRGAATRERLGATVNRGGSPRGGSRPAKVLRGRHIRTLVSSGPTRYVGAVTGRPGGTANTLLGADVGQSWDGGNAGYPHGGKGGRDTCMVALLLLPANITLHLVRRVRRPRLHRH